MVVENQKIAAIVDRRAFVLSHDFATGHIPFIIEIGHHYDERCPALAGNLHIRGKVFRVDALRYDYQIGCTRTAVRNLTISTIRTQIGQLQSPFVRDLLFEQCSVDDCRVIGVVGDEF